jgi:hypothetical protein
MVGELEVLDLAFMQPVAEGTVPACFFCQVLGEIGRDSLHFTGREGIDLHLLAEDEAGDLAVYYTLYEHRSCGSQQCFCEQRRRYRDRWRGDLVGGGIRADDRVQVDDAPVLQLRHLQVREPD